MRFAHLVFVEAAAQALPRHVAVAVLAAVRPGTARRYWWGCASGARLIGFVDVLAARAAGAEGVYVRTSAG